MVCTFSIPAAALPMNSWGKGTIEDFQRIWYMNPSLFFGSKLVFWGISCHKTDLDERWVLLCGNQHHCVDNFTFESISLELFASGKECSGVVTGGRSVLWLNSPSLVWENWGMIPSCPVKNRMQMGIPAPSYLLASPRTWEQSSFCWDPRASSYHSKESWLNHSGFKLPLQRELTRPLWTYK